MRAPRHATALIRVYSRSDGINEITFATSSGERKTVLHFSPYPKRPDMQSGAALLERTWELLDECMDGIKSKDVSDEKKSELKVKARTTAEILAMLMEPFFTDPDEVAKEAARRWKARQEGDEEYETPGLASTIWEPPAPKPAAKAAPAPKKAVVKNTKPLPPEAIPGVKLAIESGKFTKQQLATMYGVSIETLEAAVGS